MTDAEKLAAAQRALELAKSYKPHGDLERRAADTNIDQIEAYIARLRHPHPAGGTPGPAA